MPHPLGMIPLPDGKGPRLRPFPGNIDDVHFVRLLSSRDQTSNNVPHSRVFLVRIAGKSYALKVFNFFSLEEIRPFTHFREHLLKNKDKIIRDQLDPFFAECRAFGRLVEVGRDDELAVRCYGYAMLSKSVERQIQKQFGIADWNRGDVDQKQHLRAIVKSYIVFKTPFNRKPFAVMRKNIQQLNDLGIYNMDIRKGNYLGGRLFDFSISITSPHLSLWTKLRFRDKIQADLNFDLECLDEIVEEAEQQMAEDGRGSKRYDLRLKESRGRPK